MTNTSQFLFRFGRGHQVQKQLWFACRNILRLPDDTPLPENRAKIFAYVNDWVEQYGDVQPHGNELQELIMSVGETEKLGQQIQEVVNAELRRICRRLVRMAAWVSGGVILLYVIQRPYRVFGSEGNSK